jgi:hypothetical protein
MNIYNFIDFFFFGFAVYSFFFVVYKQFDFYKTSETLKLIDKSAITVVSIAGLAYAAVWLVDIALILLGTDIENKSSFIRRATGIYWFGYWLQPTLYVLATQLLRIKKIANHGFLRFFLAFLLFFNFEKFVIIVTSLHRDYLPSSWSMYGGFSFFGWIIADWAIKLILFSAFVIVTYYLKARKTL